jgi:tRNA (adenine57-N1/adenine58-N1)-methyltransferase
MDRPTPAPVLRANDLVLLLSADRKRFIVRLEEGGEFHTHRGRVAHDDVIGQAPGARVTGHSGEAFTVMRPSLEEMLLTVKRATQIVYPKDIGYILLKLTVVPGARVIEAGSGSGGLTCALARYVTPGGRVYSYETRREMLDLAAENVARLNLTDSVTFQHRDIEEGFDETDADAVFLDVREPWHFLRQVARALVPGGGFGAVVPTMNQVLALVAGLERAPFSDLEVSELLLRQYKPAHERVRPQDRLTAHTGYLIFARYIPRPPKDEVTAPDPTSLQ